MKRFVFIVLLFTLEKAFASETPSVGILLGEPSGISFGLLSEERKIDILVGWNFT